MNRRSFLAGLMASAAVAPLAAKLPAMVLRTTIEAHEVYGYSPGMASIQAIRDKNVLLRPFDYAGLSRFPEALER